MKYYVSSIKDASDCICQSELLHYLRAKISKMWQVYMNQGSSEIKRK
jgi:hypothetical protein